MKSFKNPRKPCISYFQIKSIESKSQIRLVGSYVNFIWRLGKSIGKGAFGNVFKALNTETGQIMAIKQISVSNLSEDQSNLIKKEINLMKRLSHRNMAKYIGTVYLDVIMTSILILYWNILRTGLYLGIIKRLALFRKI